MTTAAERINELQRRVLRGEEPTVEEMAEAIRALRIERGAVAVKAEEKREAKVKAANLDIAALFAPKPKADGSA